MNYKKENCHSYIRSVKTHGLLTTIVTGQHAHKYSVQVNYAGKPIKHITMPNRIMALAEERKYHQAYSIR